MALLIDGYNLLNATDLAGTGRGPTELHRARQALVEFLAAAVTPADRAATTIVFDAAGAPPGLPASAEHEGLTILFARGYADADTMLEEIIERHPAPRELTVVSGDHRVQRAARRRGAKWIDSDKWYAEMAAGLRAADRPAASTPSKPQGPPSPAETAYWAKRFGKPPTAASLKDDPMLARLLGPLKPAEQEADTASPGEKSTAGPESSSHRQGEDQPVDKDRAIESLGEDRNPFPPGYGEDLLA